MATYSLTAEGDRNTPVDAVEARRIIAVMEEVIAENEGATLAMVNLGCRTYREDGVDELVQFLTPERVQHVTKVMLDDMIAGVMTDPALRILRAICDIFRDCKLVFVDLSDNALGNRGLEECDSVLGQQDRLEELYLRDNGIAAESMALLQEQLEGSEHLTTLLFYNNMVGPSGAVHFAAIVGSCPRLRYVTYAQVRAGLAGTCAVLQALAANEQLQLIKLDINGGKLYSADEPDGIEALCTVLRQSPELLDLDISDSEITDAGMNPIAEAILESEALLSNLNVSENELSPGCCERLSNVLRQQRASLLTFNAYTNDLTSEGVETLMAAFDTDDAGLRELNLSENVIGHAGAVALERAVLPNIQVVNLSGNGFVLRDVTRLQRRFGPALQELEDNDSDAEYTYDGELSDEDEEIEEELEAVNEAPVEPDFDPVDLLSQRLDQQHLG